MFVSSVNNFRSLEVVGKVVYKLHMEVQIKRKSVAGMVPCPNVTDHFIFARKGFPGHHSDWTISKGTSSFLGKDQNIR